MPETKKKVSLIYFVILTLLLVGLVPLVLAGWLLSDKSGRELRSAENRYQIQLVQEKAHHIEMFGKRYSDLVTNLASAIELSNVSAVLSAPQTEVKLGSILQENPDLLALYIKPPDSDSLSVFRAETIKRDDVDRIAADANSGLANGKVDAGELQTIFSTVERVMTLHPPPSPAGHPPRSSPLPRSETFPARPSAMPPSRRMSFGVTACRSFSSSTSREIPFFTRTRRSPRPINR